MAEVDPAILNTRGAHDFLDDDSITGWHQRGSLDDPYDYGLGNRDPTSGTLRARAGVPRGALSATDVNGNTTVGGIEDVGFLSRSPGLEYHRGRDAQSRRELENNPNQELPTDIEVKDWPRSRQVSFPTRAQIRPWVREEFLRRERNFGLNYTHDSLGSATNTTPGEGPPGSQWASVMENPDVLEPKWDAQLYKGPRSSWIRFCSNAIVPRDEDPALTMNGFIMMGNGDFYDTYGFDRGDGSGGGAGDASTVLGYDVDGEEHKINEEQFKHRPTPGVVSVESEDIEPGKGFRKTTVNFTCWSKQQLDYLSHYFFQVGITASVEWGWNTYPKDALMKLQEEQTLVQIFNNDVIEIPGSGIHLNSHDGVDSYSHDNLNPGQSINAVTGEVTGPTGTVSAPKDRQTSAASWQLRKGEGNYGFALGLIHSFNFSIREDGGFDCTVQIACMSELTHQLHVIASKKNKSNNKKHKIVDERVEDIQNFMTNTLGKLLINSTTESDPEEIQHSGKIKMHQPRKQTASDFTTTASRYAKRQRAKRDAIKAQHEMYRTWIWKPYNVVTGKTKESFYSKGKTEYMPGEEGYFPATMGKTPAQVQEIEKRARDIGPSMFEHSLGLGGGGGVASGGPDAIARFDKPTDAAKTHTTDDRDHAANYDWASQYYKVERIEGYSEKIDDEQYRTGNSTTAKNAAKLEEQWPTTYKKPNGTIVRRPEDSAAHACPWVKVWVVRTHDEKTGSGDVTEYEEPQPIPKNLFNPSATGLQALTLSRGRFFTFDPFSAHKPYYAGKNNAGGTYITVGYLIDIFNIFFAKESKKTGARMFEFSTFGSRAIAHPNIKSTDGSVLLIPNSLAPRWNVGLESAGNKYAYAGSTVNMYDNEDDALNRTNSQSYKVLKRGDHTGQTREDAERLIANGHPQPAYETTQAYLNMVAGQLDMSSSELTLEQSLREFPRDDLHRILAVNASSGFNLQHPELKSNNPGEGLAHRAHLKSGTFSQIEDANDMYESRPNTVRSFPDYFSDPYLGSTLGYSGRVQDLFVNMEVIKASVNKHDRVDDMIMDIMKKVSNAAGNIWNFQLIGADANTTSNTITQLVDSNYSGIEAVGEQKPRAWVFKAHQGDSIIRAMSMDVDIKSEVSSQVLYGSGINPKHAYYQKGRNDRILQYATPSFPEGEGAFRDIEQDQEAQDMASAEKYIVPLGTHGMSSHKRRAFSSHTTAADLDPDKWEIEYNKTTGENLSTGTDRPPSMVDQIIGRNTSDIRETFPDEASRNKRIRELESGKLGFVPNPPGVKIASKLVHTEGEAYPTFGQSFGEHGSSLVGSGRGYTTRKLIVNSNWFNQYAGFDSKANTAVYDRVGIADWESAKDEPWYQSQFRVKSYRKRRALAKAELDALASKEYTDFLTGNSAASIALQSMMPGLALPMHLNKKTLESVKRDAQNRNEADAYLRSNYPYEVTVAFEGDHAFGETVAERQYRATYGKPVTRIQALLDGDPAYSKSELGMEPIQNYELYTAYGASGGKNANESPAFMSKFMGQTFGDFVSDDGPGGAPVSEYEIDIEMVDPDVNRMMTAMQRDNHPKNNIVFNHRLDGIELSLTLDGIEGLRLWDVFSCTGVPVKYYRSGIFAISAIKHSVSANDWTTEVSALFFPDGGMR